jgi:hypothetical protein
MAIYGLYARDISAGDLVWFTSDRPLAPGAYTFADNHNSSPAVYVAESIAGLVLMVGQIIDQAERGAQESLGSPGIPADIKRRVANGMTDKLLERLTETSSIWEPNPPWVTELRPVSQQSS